jgi:hypothetical protein
LVLVLGIYPGVLVYNDYDDMSLRLFPKGNTIALTAVVILSSFVRGKLYIWEYQSIDDMSMQCVSIHWKSKGVWKGQVYLYSSVMVIIISYISSIYKRHYINAPRFVEEGPSPCPDKGRRQPRPSVPPGLVGDRSSTRICESSPAMKGSSSGNGGSGFARGRDEDCTAPGSAVAVTDRVDGNCQPLCISVGEV